MFVATLLFATFAVSGALVALAVPAWLVAVTYLAASAGGIAGKVVADPAGYAVTGILIADVGATRGLATMIAAGAVITLVIPFLGPVRRLQAAHPPPGAANP